jgi:hypothetical protein
MYNRWFKTYKYTTVHGLGRASSLLEIQQVYGWRPFDHIYTQDVGISTSTIICFRMPFCPPRMAALSIMIFFFIFPFNMRSRRGHALYIVLFGTVVMMLLL